MTRRGGTFSGSRRACGVNPPPPVDADVAAYLANVAANGGTVGTTTTNAIKALVQGLKSAGLWAKIYELGPMAGNVLAMPVKLKYLVAGGSAVATNVGITSGNWTETGATAGLGGSAHSAATEYLLSGFNPATAGVALGSYGFGYYYSQTNDYNSPMAQVAGGDTGWLTLNLGGTAYCSNNSGTSAVGGGAMQGMMFSSRLNTTEYDVYNNATATTVAVSASSVQNGEVYIGRDTYGRGSYGYIRLWIFTQGLTSVEYTSLRTAIQSYQTAMNRQV